MPGEHSPGVLLFFLAPWHLARISHSSRLWGCFCYVIDRHTRGSVQFSRVRLFATPWIAARQASLSITNSQSSPRLTCMESVMPSSHLILCRPLLLLLPIPPSIRVFSNESTLFMRWPKYWSFHFSIIPSKEIPGLISFRMDWFTHPLSQTINHVKHWILCLDTLSNRKLQERAAKKKGGRWAERLDYLGP